MAIEGYGNLWIVCSNGTLYGLYEMTAPLATTSTACITVTRTIAPTTATPRVGFTGIAFNPTGNIYMATSTDLYILKTSFTLTHIGAFSVAGVSGDLTSCSYPFSVLPLNFLNFAASEKDNVVSLDWTVSQSDNNKGFYIEKVLTEKTGVSKVLLKLPQVIIQVKIIIHLLILILSRDLIIIASNKLILITQPAILQQKLFRFHQLKKLLFGQIPQRI
ncbi:MAG TPA: hypothetical protein VIH86_14380 [Puia sp.]|jgi:hypothetical protein